MVDAGLRPFGFDGRRVLRLPPLLPQQFQELGNVGGDAPAHLGVVR